MLKGKWISAVLCAILLAGLLTACGDPATNNNSFEVPALTGMEEVPSASQNQDLRNRLLLPNRKNDIADQNLKVYQVANRSLADLEKGYTDEMARRGWTNVSPNITGPDELGSQGVIRAFEKYVDGDVNRKRVAGFIMLAPDARTDLLGQVRSIGGIDPTRTIVIEITGGVSLTNVTPRPNG
jgi:hypothetical protein